MKYSISLPLPRGWNSSSESFSEEGVDLFQFSAENEDKAINIIVGPLPEGQSLMDSACGSFLESEAESYQSEQEALEGFQKKISTVQFKGSEAYSYSTLSESSTPVRYVFSEILPGVLAMISIEAAEEAAIDPILKTIEKKISVNMSF